MEALLSIFIVSFIAEAIVNLVVSINDKETSWKYWASLIFGILVSVVVTWNWNIDIFQAVGLPPGNVGLIGPILTGLLISRGSNVINDVISRIGSTGNNLA